MDRSLESPTKKNVSGYPFHKHTNMLSMNNLFRWPRKFMIKKNEGPALNKQPTVNSPQEVSVIEITVDRFECRSFNFYFF